MYVQEPHRPPPKSFSYDMIHIPQYGVRTCTSASLLFTGTTTVSRENVHTYDIYRVTACHG